MLPGPELGGAERQALLVGRHLQREKGANVHVWFCQDGTGRALFLCNEYGLPFKTMPLHWSTNRLILLKNLSQFALALRLDQPDILLPYLILPNIACGLIWRWTGAQACIWNQRDEGLVRMGIKLERRAIKQIKCFISNSQGGAQFLEEVLGADPSYIHVIHNGVALEQPESDKKTWRRQLGIDDDCFVACMVSNLHHLKDHETLLQAWKKVTLSLESVGRSAVLLLAGIYGDTYQLLKMQAFDLGLCGAVKFLGQVADIPGLLSAIDLGVFSSRKEGCPNGVLECMAYGLPVAGTDIPGIREAVGSANYQFLAPPGDADLLAQCILRLASDSLLSRKIGELNAQRINQEFSLEFMCEQTSQQLVKALDGNFDTQFEFTASRS